MAKVNVGTTIDLDKLLETRLLIQANSGGGKSWNIRKLLEETHGKVQQIVLDIEGEFSSLREEYDFILAGKGGDIEANPRTAELLAQKILELNVSIIIDLYELKQHDRIKFVAKFLDAMINAPKNLWHPALVVVDEAHLFAPESGHAESSSAVIDLATRGRKRGFCAVIATQRLSKLNKDVAAECNNKMIGRTGLDIDMKRAADELGFSKADMLKLRDLDPGQFYAFGPAISRGVELVQIGKVKTQHYKAGKKGIYTPTPPTDKVRSVLLKLADLPHEAEKELKDKAALQDRVRELERELRKKPIEQAHVVDDKAISRAVGKAVSAAIAATIDEDVKLFKVLLENLKGNLNQTITTFADREIGKIKNMSRAPVASNFQDIMPKHPYANTPVANKKPMVVIPKHPVVDGVMVELKSEFIQSIGKCEKLILSFLWMRRGAGFTKVQIGAMTGYSHGSGSFNNSISKLSSGNLITKSGDLIYINEGASREVQGLVGDNHVDQTQALEDWLNRLGKCEKNIYQKLLDEPDRIYSKEELGDITGYAASSGSFNNSISKLCTLGLAGRINNGIQLNPDLLQV